MKYENYIPMSNNSYFNLLGIGTSGCKMIRSLRDNKYAQNNEDVTFTAIHYNADDLETSEADNTLLIDYDRLKLDEYNQLTIEGKEYLCQCIGEQFRQVVFFFIVADFSNPEIIHLATCLTKLLTEKEIS